VDTLAFRRLLQSRAQPRRGAAGRREPARRRPDRLRGWHPALSRRLAGRCATGSSAEIPLSSAADGREQRYARRAARPSTSERGRQHDVRRQCRRDRGRSTAVWQRQERREGASSRRVAVRRHRRHGKCSGPTRCSRRCSPRWRRKMTPYIHHWQPGELVIWDNWPCSTRASGHSPGHGRPRIAQRSRGTMDWGGSSAMSSRPAPTRSWLRA